MSGANSILLLFAIVYAANGHDHEPKFIDPNAFTSFFGGFQQEQQHQHRSPPQQQPPQPSQPAQQQPSEQESSGSRAGENQQSPDSCQKRKETEHQIVPFKLIAFTYSFALVPLNRLTNFAGRLMYLSWLDRPSSQQQENWNDARKFCREHCMDLASVESQDTHKFLAHKIREGTAEIWMTPEYLSHTYSGATTGAQKNEGCVVSVVIFRR